MNLVKAELLAKRLIAQYLDSSWTFKFSHAKKWMGICDYKKKQIRLSELHTHKSSDEEVLDTILHEIAHALTPGAGHGPKWEAVAKSIGCSGNVRGKSEATISDMCKWCVVTQEGKPIKYYARRPPRKSFRDIAHKWIVGKPETKGTLRIVPFRNGAPVLA